MLYFIHSGVDGENAFLVAHLARFRSMAAGQILIPGQPVQGLVEVELGKERETVTTRYLVMVEDIAMERTPYTNSVTPKPALSHRLISEHNNALNITVNHTENNTSDGLLTKNIGNMVR